MRLECVVVSVGCGDYLAATVPLNRSLFNRLVVVSSFEDAETKRVCEYHNVECLRTKAFYANGCKFNKGAAVNEALLHLEKTGGLNDWVAHMDADIVLPPLTRQILEKVGLNEQFLYGIDRLMCPTYEHWSRFLSSPLPQHEMSYVHLSPWQVGTRLMKLEQGGWVPLGYFQMFNRKATSLGKPPFYPVEFDSAATSDLYFAYKWPRTHRHLIPEIAAIHLATGDITAGEMGQNWEGRTTSRFGPRDDPYYGGAGYRPRPVVEKKDKSEKKT